MIAAVTCSFFATHDSPIGGMRIFLKGITIAISISIFYSMMILPAAITFESMVIALSPRIMVDELFNDSASGTYWYYKGINPQAVLALLPSVIICLLINYIPRCFPEPLSTGAISTRLLAIASPARSLLHAVSLNLHSPPAARLPGMLSVPSP